MTTCAQSGKGVREGPCAERSRAEGRGTHVALDDLARDEHDGGLVVRVPVLDDLAV